MAHDILARLRDNLLLRASVATVTGIVLLGVASGALPLTCFVGLAACETSTAAVADPTAPEMIPTGKVTSGQGVKTVAEIAPPTLTSNDVVGATFAMLNIDLAPPPAEDGELKTRKVRTVAIGPDGQPQGLEPEGTKPKDLAPPASLAPASTTAVASTSPTSRTMDNPGTRAAATISHPPAAAVPPADVPPPTAVATELAIKPPAKDSTTAVVKNSGANVRSAPSKAKSTVLFALPGGTTVTIGENSRGWLKVTDAKGRTGWVYQDLLVRD